MEITAVVNGSKRKNAKKIIERKKVQKYFRYSLFGKCLAKKSLFIVINYGTNWNQNKNLFSLLKKISYCADERINKWFI